MIVTVVAARVREVQVEKLELSCPVSERETSRLAVFREFTEIFGFACSAILEREVRVVRRARSRE